MSSLLARKTFESVKEGSGSSLSKTMGAFDLILLGLGAIIGTGVFVVTGMVAAKYSGPAVMLSYSIAGGVCIFVALAYAELSAMLPTSGSIYTYSYVAFGEVFAWLIGSVIILEFAFASGVVAAGWSGYVQVILQAGGIYLPKAITTVPAHGGIINLPAFVIVAFVSFILYLGTKDSKKLNAILVFIKMAAIFVFIVAATPHFKIENWHNFMPFGPDNMVVGASILFFAFTGFSSIATAAEECKNPKRDLMIGIIGSLILACVVYVILSGLVTGIVPFDQLNNAQPLAHALKLNNSNIGSAIVATGAICGMTTVIMANIYALSRIFYVIARDGLLPTSLAKIHAKYGSPYIMIRILFLLISFMGAFCPVEILTQLSSMGALIDYIVIMLIVMLFRHTLPQAARPFRCPAIFVIAPLGCISCVYLLFKQILDKDGSLLITGKIIIYWFIGVFILYLFRMLLLKIRNS